MSTIFNNIFSINGVLDTNKSVLENMNALCTSANAWLTYDIAQGKWAVIINRSDSSLWDFNDSNIIGNINVSGTGVNELYNRVEVEFPHKDIRDEKDYIVLSIPEEDRYPAEIDNTLTIKLDCINDPLQAQYIGMVELKQSRLDKIVEFRTDFTAVGIKAGDIITVTNSIYGFSNKQFRVTRISEEDDDSGNIVLSITALEFNSSIFDMSGLVREEKSKVNGIILKSMNATTDALDDVDAGDQIFRLLAANAVTGLLDMLFSKDPITGKITQILKPKPGIKEDILKKIATVDLSLSGPDEVCECDTIVIDIIASNCISECIGSLEYTYKITGVQSNDIGIPLTGTVTVTNGAGSLSIPLLIDTLTESETLKITIEDQEHEVKIKDNNPTYTLTTTPTDAEIIEGQPVIINIETDAPDGYIIDWEISGSAADKVDGPLTGTIAVSAGEATIDIFTIDDGIYTGDKSLTITIATNEPNCSCDSDKTINVTVKDNESPPEPPEPTTPCEWVDIPVAWCGNYSSVNGELVSVSASSTVTVQKKVTGLPSAVVPLTISVTRGSPSIITVTSTVEVCTASGQAGFDCNIITAFDPVPANQKVITGTTTTIRGH